MKFDEFVAVVDNVLRDELGEDYRPPLRLHANPDAMPAIVWRSRDDDVGFEVRLIALPYAAVATHWIRRFERQIESRGEGRQEYFKDDGARDLGRRIAAFLRNGVTA